MADAPKASDPNRQAALADTQALLNSPERLRALQDPRAKASLDYVQKLMPGAAEQNQLMGLSGDIFESLIAKGFDDQKLMEIIEEAGRNPTSLKKYLSGAQLEQIQSLAKPLELRQQKP
jgi:hypothetical protein